ncbi:MAG: hypothetical protein D6785_05900, partial [Planctomycetota bacterium]
VAKGIKNLLKYRFNLYLNEVQLSGKDYVSFFNGYFHVFPEQKSWNRQNIFKLLQEKWPAFKRQRMKRIRNKKFWKLLNFVGKENEFPGPTASE